MRTRKLIERIWTSLIALSVMLAGVAVAQLDIPNETEAGGLDASVACMQCHQGGESAVSVDAAIVAAALADDDTPGLDFKSIHYLTAAATQSGANAMGGYRYAGKRYDVRFSHVEGIENCIDCHDNHSLTIKVDTCLLCHGDLANRKAMAAIRHAGSTSDHDGDGNINEGIAEEIHGLQVILYAAIQAYANDINDPIVYDAYGSPYFYKDTNGNGVVDEEEVEFSNSYSGSFTARLLRAAYNFQTSQKDYGAFAHNAKYMIQLLYDSIEDLDSNAVAGLTRDDVGHFRGSAEAFRHWDEEGEVPESCSKCHSAAGVPLFLREGVAIAQHVSNGLACSTCHDAMPAFTRHEAGPVQFPSGALVDSGESDSNLCMNCHQGRASGLTVAAAVAGLAPDAVDAGLGFINVHYYAAGATRYGTQAGGAFEYPGKVYQGFFKHVSAFKHCVDCHDAHSGRIAVQMCTMCHRGIVTPQDIRISSKDYDGDGNKTEGMIDEIATVRDALYAAIRGYAERQGVPIVYDAHSYPYFFVDGNANGMVDSDEANSTNRYNAFTPRLLEAAYNLQVAYKDPGAYAHNAKYVLQVLIDSIEDLGGAVSGMIRP